MFSSSEDQEEIDQAYSLGATAYVHKPTRTCRVWFDDLVISKKYVGPIKSKR